MSNIAGRTIFARLRSEYRLHGRRLFYPPFWAVVNYRFGHWAQGINFKLLRWLLLKIHRVNEFVVVVTGCIDLHREATIGEDLHLLHTGNIHIHPRAVLGDRVGILHDVTIGTNMAPGAPTIGDDVFIGAGAKVLGKITIGNGAIIAANSLVTTNVPAGATAVGVPARIIRRQSLAGGTKGCRARKQGE
ncbi:MAG: serine acetyltransferase [Thermodesulfobacteriota bacterium]